MIHKLIITTGCCEDSLKHKIVKLKFDYDYETFESFLKLKPTWQASGFETFKRDRGNHLFEKYVEVKFCPFCGVKTPEIELNQHAIDNFKIHDSDLDYCTVCEERNMCCNCLPPEFRWKPIGIDVDIPIIKNDNEDEE